MVSDLSLNEREQAHAAALQSFVAGDFTGGHRRLKAIVIEQPRDLVAV